MFITALCGKSGSGKSTVCKIARELGFVCFDCDKIYRELTEQPSDCQTEIFKAFPSCFNNGAVDRKKLAEIVFSDSDKLLLLNETTHKFVISELKKRICECPENSYILIDAPALFESGLNSFCDAVICVVADEDSCAKRIAVRDGLDIENAQKRLDSQKSYDFLIENSDYILYNDNDLQALAYDASLLLKDIMEENA